MISTRRFWDLPAAVSLDASGTASPVAFAVTRAASGSVDRRTRRVHEATTGYRTGMTEQPVEEPGEVPANPPEPADPGEDPGVDPPTDDGVDDIQPGATPDPESQEDRP